MARLEFKHYGNLAAFRTLPVQLFQRLLNSQPEFLEAATTRFLDLGSLEENESSREKLWSFFTEHGPELPKPLLKAMHEIDDLSTDTGHQLLVESARRCKLQLPEEAQKWTARQFALTAWLDYRGIFQESSDRNFIQQNKNFHEFVPLHPRQLQLPSQQGRERLAAALRPVFQRRFLGTSCDVRAYEDGATISFVISRGKPYRSDETQEDTGPSVIAWRPRKHDLVILDNRTGRLRIHAEDAMLVAAYREAVGDVFFASKVHFADQPIVSLEPLTVHGEKILEPTRGLTAMTLVELWLDLGEGKEGLTVSYKSRDVFRSAEEYEGIHLHHGRPIYAVLHGRFASGGRAKRIEIEPPRKIRFDSRKERENTLLFLETRGFLASPPEVIEPPRQADDD